MLAVKRSIIFLFNRTSQGRKLKITVMKKRIISALMVSTVLLSAAAPLATIGYADTNSDIQTQDATIASAQSAKAQAQAQVDSLQSKVDSLQQKQADTKKQVQKMTESLQTLNAEMGKLVTSMSERTQTLENQARSAQLNSSATGYLNAIMDSKSLTDMVQRVTAIATVTSASNQMLQEQQQEKKDLDKKSATMKKSYEQLMTLSQSLDSQAQELNSQQAQLKVATLNYDLTITTAQDKKASLLAEKASAEAAAQKAADQQAAYQQQNTAVSGSNNTSSNNAGSSSNSATNNNTSSNSNSNSGSSSSNNVTNPNPGGSSSGGSSNSNSGSSSATLAAIVSYAQSLISLNIPYVWGGTTTAGFDCSGFTSYVYANAAGISLPRVSEAQGSAGTQVPLSQARPGDLIIEENGAHVAIYLGNGLQIDASHPGKNLAVNQVSWYTVNYAVQVVQ